MTLDPTDPRPLYQQIAGRLRDDIQAGRYKAGGFVPSQRRLADQYGVAEVTARNALRELVLGGWLEARSTSGYLVRAIRPLIHASSGYVVQTPGQPLETWRTLLEKQGLAADQELVQVGRVLAPPDIAERLGLETETQAVVRRRLMRADGNPVQLADSFYPLDVAGGTRLEQPIKLRGGSVQELINLGWRFERHHEEVMTRMPTAEQRHALALGSGIPVIRLLRTSYATHEARSGEQRAIEVTEGWMTGDRHVLHYEFPGVAPLGSETVS